jgi:hypothetical protein
VSSTPKSKYSYKPNRIILTDQEFDILCDHFSDPADPLKINYIIFNEEIEKLFTEKDLEKNPVKKVQTFNAPSILDPKDVLNNDEELVLQDCLGRIGVEVKNRRLLIKPYFQDKVLDYYNHSGQEQ